MIKFDARPDLKFHQTKLPELRQDFTPRDPMREAEMIAQAELRKILPKLELSPELRPGFTPHDSIREADKAARRELHKILPNKLTKG